MYKLTRFTLIATVLLAAYCVVMLTIMIPWAWVALAIGAGIALAKRGYRYTAYGTARFARECWTATASSSGGSSPVAA
jgi:type IV secretion system protein VirD4